MLKEVGCDINENDTCSIGWHTLKVNKPDTYGGRYTMLFTIENNSCIFSISKNGNVGKIGKCIKYDCLHFGRV